MSRRGRRAAGANPPREEGNDFLRAMRDVANTLAETMANTVRDTLRANQPPVHREGMENRMRNALREVQRHNPPVFHGEPDPTVAEDWLMRVERLFDLLEVEPDLRVRVATHLLTGDALQWWASVERIREGENLTWNEFSVAFQDKYFPMIVRYRKEEEFLALKQGNMTVQQYEAQFTILSRFAPGLVGDDAMKARRFQRGLREDI